MRTWAPILHFYQPPTQAPGLTEWIKKTCYEPLLQLLVDHPEAELTINFSASLAIQLESLQGGKIFQNLQTLFDRGQIEILQSPIYHPIIPLTPLEVIKRQIIENQTTLQAKLNFTPLNGLFPPELALSPEAIQSLLPDFDFLVTDESTLNPTFDLGTLLSNSLFTHPAGKLLVVSRSLSEILRSGPKSLDPDKFANFLETNTPDGSFIASLSDAELFGHHTPERLDFLLRLIQGSKVKFAKLSSLLSKTPSQEIKESQLTSSTWQTEPNDLKNHNPFPLWQDQQNPLHEKYHQLINLAYASIQKYLPSNNYLDSCQVAVHHFDRGISSCHTLWLSLRPWWHPDLAEAGATELIKAIRTLPLDPSVKIQAEDLYYSLVQEIWHLHWSGETQKSFDVFDQKRAALIEKLPQI